MAQHISRCINKNIENILANKKINQRTLIRYWKEIVGTQFKNISQPKNIKNIPKKGNILKITVMNGRAIEMAHVTPQIIEKINTYYGYQAINDVIFVNEISNITKIKKVNPKKKYKIKLKKNIKNNKLRNALQKIAQEVK